MAVTPQKPRRGSERRSTLGMLADAPHGLTEAILMAHGVTTKLLDGLVRDGLATARPESVKAGAGREVTRVWITDAGRKAIDG
jgi:hypothetical protein